MKRCSNCKLLKKELEFQIRSDRGILNSQCRACITKKKREGHIRSKCQRNLDRDRASTLLRLYGISVIAWDEMMLSQGGLCAICADESKLCVDHDHSTGVVRGLICQNCNRALGGFKDSPKVIAAALGYLNKYSPDPLTTGLFSAL